MTSALISASPDGDEKREFLKRNAPALYASKRHGFILLTIRLWLLVLLQPLIKPSNDYPVIQSQRILEPGGFLSVCAKESKGVPMMLPALKFLL
jgi:hypothetical protein